MYFGNIRHIPPHIPISKNSGRSAAWLAHLTGGQGVGSSNLLVPTILLRGWLERANLFRFLGKLGDNFFYPSGKIQVYTHL